MCVCSLLYGWATDFDEFNYSKMSIRRDFKLNIFWFFFKFSFHSIHDSLFYFHEKKMNWHTIFALLYDFLLYFYISRSLYQIQKSVLFCSSSSGSAGVARVIWWLVVDVALFPADIVGSVFRRFILPFNFFNIVACRRRPIEKNR